MDNNLVTKKELSDNESKFPEQKTRFPTFIKLWKSIGIPEKFRQFKKEGGIKAIPSHWWIVLVLCAVVGLLFP
ncbi:MAG: hypothetical protein JSV46_08785, partial [Candidatus Aminicenantes bacterium]